MYLELHMLQSFAPSCLNRDDTNSPKDCVFGGVRRARISSQCIKRAIRLHAGEAVDLKDNMGVRTKRLYDTLVEALVAEGKPRDVAGVAVENALAIRGLKLKAKGEDASRTLLTEYLVFLGEDEVGALKKQILAHWDLLKVEQETPEEEGKKRAKKQDKNVWPRELTKAFEGVLQGRKAVDVAMFGRMLADLPKSNVDAAVQVAHAISTHKVEIEMDFYTAVDDLKPEDTAGADMMGTVEFNSACFYRYAVLNWEKLLANLGSDTDLARRAVEAFLQASIEAVPTGKQNTFAAHNPPSLVFGVARNQGVPWSLANAFERPVFANGKGIVGESIERLDAYWGQLDRVYGGEFLAQAWVGLERTEPLPVLGAPAQSANAVIAAMMAALPGEAS